MHSIKEVENLEGKRVLVRVDWNAPIEEGMVTDDFRIQASLPTIEYILERGGKPIIATHLDDANASTEPLRSYVPAGAELLENLRNNPGEQNNDEDFARYLASKADIFVNDAFSVCHREHASIVGVPKFLPSFAGLHLEEEVRQLTKVFNPPHPFLLILGGAKPETKLPLVEKFIDIADHIFIGGITAKHAFEKYSTNPKVSFPHGDITALDIDEETLENCKLKIENSRFIVWNGPLGKYEDGYTAGTLGLTRILADSGKEVIIGGGDTLSAIKELNLYDKFTFVSTGGGAMLDFLANGTLPGIEVLN